MKYLLLIILLSFLSCTKPIKEGIIIRKECIKQHDDFFLMPLLIGKTTIFVPQKDFVKNRWNIVLRDTLLNESKIEVSESIFNQIRVGNKVTIKGDTIVIKK